MDDHEPDCACEDCEQIRLWLSALFTIGLMWADRLVHA